jgi:hypothetical protein
MKKVLGLAAATGMALSMFAATASAENMGDKMKMGMEHSMSCSQTYMQCIMAANKMSSTPQGAMAQIKENMMMSSECGKAAMACQKGM